MPEADRGDMRWLVALLEAEKNLVFQVLSTLETCQLWTRTPPGLGCIGNTPTGTPPLTMKPEPYLAVLSVV